MYQVLTSVLPMTGIYYTIVLHFLDFKKKANLKDPMENITDLFFGKKEQFTNLKKSDKMNDEEFVDKVILNRINKNGSIETFINLKKTATWTYRYLVVSVIIFSILIISRLRKESGDSSLSIFR